MNILQIAGVGERPYPCYSQHTHRFHTACTWAGYRWKSANTKPPRLTAASFIHYERERTANVRTGDLGPVSQRSTKYRR